MRTEELIRESNGRLFTVEFYKKNGELRRMRARLGVQKGLTGRGMSWNPLERGYLPVWDVQKKGYRLVNLATVQRLRVNGKNYEFVASRESQYLLEDQRRRRQFSYRPPRTRRYGSEHYRMVLDRDRDPNDCTNKERVGYIHLPEGEGWRVDVFADKTCKVGCTAFGTESTKNVYDLLSLIFRG